MANLIITDADETKETLSTTGPTVVDLLHLDNAGAVDMWVHLYDRNAAGLVTVGTTPPALSFKLRAGETREWINLRFASGLILAAVAEFSGGATGPATNAVNGSAIL